MKNNLGRNRRKHQKKIKDWRDSQSCVLCGKTKHLTVHHIIHKSNGGKLNKRNLVVLCRGCHNEEHREKKNTFWSEPEIYGLVNLRKSGMSYQEISKLFGRSISALQTQMHNIKLRVDLVSTGMKNN